jgi:hypothetical protein
LHPSKNIIYTIACIIQAAAQDVKPKFAGLYEYQGGDTTHYYEGNAFRRTGPRGHPAINSGVFYLLQDHLGSNRDLINQDGTRNGRNFYFPYGGNRAGVPFNPRSTQRFTEQYHEQELSGGEGLSYYKAR